MQTDLRTRYTRQVIDDAFLQLLRQKPVERITVKEVCALAQINRSTFYRQYKDCFDLMEQLQQRALELLDALLQSAEAQGTEATMTAVLGALRGNDSLLRSGMREEPARVAAVINALCEGAALAPLPQAGTP